MIVAVLDTSFVIDLLKETKRGVVGRASQKSAELVLRGEPLRITHFTIAELFVGVAKCSRPVSIPDLHATIHCALGINPREELFAGSRPVPVTDDGKPVRELFT